MGNHSIYFYILIAIMLLAVLQTLSLGVLFFLKRSGGWRANIFYGLLLLAFGFTTLHHILNLFGIFDTYPITKFMPIYFTLWIPILLFFHVKFFLYPKYRFKWTDTKHFFVPFTQTLFFILLFFSPIAYKSEVHRSFFNPWFGAFEQILYLGGFYMYWLFGFRYLRRRRKNAITPLEKKQVWYAKNLMKYLLILFSVHTAFVLSDFLFYQLFNIDLRSNNVFTALGIISFTMLCFWIGTYGFQTLVWGRKLLHTQQQKTHNN